MCRHGPHLFLKRELRRLNSAIYATPQGHLRVTYDLLTNPHASALHFKQTSPEFIKTQFVARLVGGKVISPPMMQHFERPLMFRKLCHARGLDLVVFGFLH
jgi:hypothetical protein